MTELHAASRHVLVDGKLVHSAELCPSEILDSRSVEAVQLMTKLLG